MVNSRNIAILWGLERSVRCPKLPEALRLRAGFVVLHVSHSHFLFPALAKWSFQRAAANVYCRRCPPPPPRHRHRHRHLHHRHRHRHRHLHHRHRHRLLHHRHLHLHHLHRHRHHHLHHHHHHRRRRSRHRHRHRHRHCIFIIFIFIVIIITTIIMISSISNISNNTLNLCFQFCDSKTIVTTTTTTTTTPSAASSSTSTHLQLHSVHLQLSRQVDRIFRWIDIFLGTPTVCPGVKMQCIRHHQLYTAGDMQV